MTEIKINTDELVAVYRICRDRPHEWDQSAWAWEGRGEKGTPIEGIAAMRRANRDHVSLHWIARSRTVRTLEGIGVGGAITVQSYAREALGLTTEQAEMLFERDVQLLDVRRLILQWTGVDPGSDENDATDYYDEDYLTPQLHRMLDGLGQRVARSTR